MPRSNEEQGMGKHATSKAQQGWHILVVCAIIVALELGVHSYMGSGLPGAIWLLKVYNFGGQRPPRKSAFWIFDFALPAGILVWVFVCRASRWSAILWWAALLMAFAGLFLLFVADARLLPPDQTWWLPTRGAALLRFYGVQAVIVFGFFGLVAYVGRRTMDRQQKTKG